MQNSSHQHFHSFHRLPGSVHLVIMAFFVIGFAVLVSLLHPSITNAGPTDNVTGYAWSGVAGAGWISLNNCIDPTTCSGTSYGVSIHPTSGVWSGSGWSSNVGWIDFGSNPCGSVTTNMTTGLTTGMAHVRSQSGSSQAGGFSGCIAMSGNAQNGNPYGVLVNTTTGNMQGYAWSGDDVTADINGDGTNEWTLDGRPDVGLGWIDFSYAHVELEEELEDVYVDLIADGVCNAPVTFTWDTLGVDTASCQLYQSDSLNPNPIAVSGFNPANMPHTMNVSGENISLFFQMSCASEEDSSVLITSSPESFVCLGEAIYACNDGDDNDNDGLTDESDPLCHYDCNANNPNSYVPSDTSEAGSCLDPINNINSPLNQTEGKAPIYIES